MNQQSTYVANYDDQENQEYTEYDKNTETGLNHEEEYIEYEGFFVDDKETIFVMFFILENHQLKFPSLYWKH